MTGVSTPWLDAYLDPGILTGWRAQMTDAVSAGRRALAIGPGALIDAAIDDVVRSALHLDVLALLAEGWATASEIRELGKKTPPGQTAILRLAPHSITREIQPVIIVHFGADHKIPVNVAIEIAGSFLGIELSVENQAITAVGTGHCELSVQPKFAGQHVGQPKIIRDWTLPGRYAFQTPIAVR